MQGQGAGALESCFEGLRQGVTMWVCRRACGLGKEVGWSWQGNFWGRFRSLLLWEDFGGFFVRRVVCGTEEFWFSWVGVRY